VLFGQSAGPANSAMTIVLYLYQFGFQAGDLGYAAAVGWVLVTLILVMGVFQYLLFRRGARLA
jgi:ABC-type sugar transport system permease subunit